MMFGICCGSRQAFDDGSRRRQIGIADAKIDDVYSLRNIAVCFILSIAAKR